MANKIYRNIEMEGTFETRDSTGTLFSPGSMAVNIVQPGGSKTPATTVVNTGTGLWTFTYTPTEPGAHTVEATGTTSGAIVARGRGAFFVAQEEF